MTFGSSRWATWVGAAIVAGAAGACSAGGPGAPAGGSSDASHFVDQFADELCALAAQCCSATGHTAPSNCSATARQQLHAETDPAIATGLQLDTTAASQCLAAYQALAPSCPLTWDRTPLQVCKQALVGTSPPGGSCDLGCAPSAEGQVVCSTTSTIAADGGTTTTPKICQVRIVSPPGGVCDSDYTQARIHACDSSAASFCNGGTCTTPVGLGASCAGSDCVATAYCHNGTCEPKLAIGATCSGSSNDCVAGATCNATTLTCVAADSWQKVCSGDFN